MNASVYVHCVTGVSYGYKPPCRFWEPSSGPVNALTTAGTLVQSLKKDKMTRGQLATGPEMTQTWRADKLVKGPHLLVSAPQPGHESLKSTSQLAGRDSSSRRARAQFGIQAVPTLCLGTTRGTAYGTVSPVGARCDSLERPGMQHSSSSCNSNRPGVGEACHSTETCMHLGPSASMKHVKDKAWTRHSG